MALRDFLWECGLEHLEPLLREASVDLDILADLDERDLAGLGVALGDRKRLARCLRGKASATPHLPSERRLLSVLFIDLVGYTALSRDLDPEQLQSLVRRFQSLTADAVVRFGGSVAQYLGDGILAYFGYPLAHEDDPERAVRAATDALGAVPGLSGRRGEPLAARAAVATGLVVLGDVTAAELVGGTAAFGETPNLAARLQGIAETGEVVIDEVTRRLTGSRFDTEAAEGLVLKGFPPGMRAWRVRAVRQDASRFDARSGPRAQFVGRDDQLAQLRQAWLASASGAGRVVELVAEAGIGKSRLCAELAQFAQAHGGQCCVLQCSPHHTGSEYYVLRDIVSRLASSGGSSRGGLRQRLVDEFTGRAAAQPLLLVLEDTHWIDPSSAEWLQKVAAACRQAPLLLVFTTRPGGMSEHPVRAAERVTLERLDSADSLILLERLASGTALPRALRERILQQADGVPLFIEEIAAAVLEALASGGKMPDVPDTLQASLLARLERLGPARRVLQVASVVGRLFEARTLVAGLGLDAAEVDMSLDVLSAAGLVQPDGDQGIWRIKHALIQECAYSTLLLATRKELHGQLADHLLARGSASEVEAVTVAVHLTAAGRSTEALAAWESAGDQASARGAAGEAVHHFEQALAIVRGLPADEARERTELDLLLKLGPLLMMSKGVGAPHGLELSRRALELARRCGTEDELFSVAFAAWYGLENQCRPVESEPLLRELQRLAEASGRPVYRLQARHAVWTSNIMRGSHHEVIAAADEGMALYDSRDRSIHIARFGGHDPYPCALSHMAASHWALGDLRRAFESMARSLEAADASRNLASKMVSLIGFSTLHFQSRMPEMIPGPVDEFVELGRKAGLATGMLTIASDWAKVTMGTDAAALQRMVKLTDALRVSGSRLRLGLYLVMLAEAWQATGDLARARDTVIAAREWMDTYHEPNVRPVQARCAGDIARAAGDRAEAASHYREAIELARAGAMKGFELPAALALARLEVEDGRLDALAQLQHLLAHFEGQPDTPDLAAARRLCA
ncbi:MAG: AAA family ATPase [Burkholderiales bacterium]|nr:AAA family ATPase [Burkholderiales bacterium]